MNSTFLLTSTLLAALAASAGSLSAQPVPPPPADPVELPPPAGAGQAANPIVAADIITNPALQGALAALPPATNVLFAVNLRSFEAQDSLLSYVPVDEMTDMVDAQLAQTGETRRPVQSPAEAALRLAFLPSARESLHALVIGSHASATTTEDPPVHAVIAGRFDDVTLAPELAEQFQLAEGPDPAIRVMKSAEGEDIYVAVPQDNVILVSGDLNWVSKGVGYAATDKGLSAPTSAFSKTYGTITEEAPDAFLFVDSALLREAAQQQPQMQMMVGPLLQSNGLMLTLMPGQAPQVQLAAGYDSAQNAALGKQLFDQFLMMGRAQMQQFANNADPSSQPQMQGATDVLNKLQTSTNGNAATLTYTIDELPDRAEFQQQIMQAMEEAMAGGFGMPMGGNL